MELHSLFFHVLAWLLGQEAYTCIKVLYRYKGKSILPVFTGIPLYKLPTLPGTFKVDHLHPFRPNLLLQFSIWFIILLGDQFLLPQSQRVNTQ